MNIDLQSGNLNRGLVKNLSNDWKSMEEKKEDNLEGDSHGFEEFLLMIVPIICTVPISDDSSKQMVF